MKPLALEAEGAGVAALKARSLPPASHMQQRPGSGLTSPVACHDGQKRAPCVTPRALAARAPALRPQWTAPQSAVPLPG